MVGDAVVQFEEGLLQEIPFGVAEKFQTGAGMAAAEHGAKGDYQDVVAGMAAGIAGVGVIQGAEQAGELGHGGITSLLQTHATPGGVGRYHTEHRKIHMR